MICKQRSRFAVFKGIILWAFIVVCTMMIFGFIRDHLPRSGQAGVPVGPETIGQFFYAIILDLTPLLFLAALLGFVQFWYFPRRLRRKYQMNPVNQGQCMVNLTKESVSIDNSAGVSSKSSWNLFDSWFIEKSLLVLKHRSGIYVAMSLAALSEAQQDELRGILTAVLPKK